MRPRIRKESPFGVLLCDVKDAAMMCGLGVSTVWKLVKHDEHFPKPVYFNARCARFKVDDLRKWAAELNGKQK